jgi:hypothetical protein
MTTREKKENRILISVGPTSKGKGDDDDSQELERITYSLRDDLTDLDAVEKVDLVTKGVAPERSKGGELAALGSLLVTFGASAAAAAGSTIIPNLTNALQSWLTRNERHKITLEIGGDKLEVTGLADIEQQKLIDVWISHHLEKRANI